MEDTFSRTSQDSAVEEFVVVTTEPKLHIAGDGGASELERKMTEVLNDDICSVNSSSTPGMAETDKLSEPLGDKLITPVTVQQSDEAAAEPSDASHTPESGNSFNNLNTSAPTTMGPGKC